MRDSEKKTCENMADELSHYLRSGSANVSTTTIVKVLYEAIRLRDPHTARHSLKVGTYSYLLARELDPNQAIEYFLGGLVHDVGKIAFPDFILVGSAKLDFRHRQQIQKHVHDSVQILKKLSLPDTVIGMAQYHHERYDSTGYLEGLNGDAIPREGRITAVADVYSAITDPGRNYQEARTEEQAIAILIHESKQFDPTVLNILIDQYRSYSKGFPAEMEAIVFTTFEQFLEADYPQRHAI